MNENMTLESSSPITILWGNIIHRFETITPDAIMMHQDAVNEGKVSPSIVYDNEKNKVKGPHSKPDTREIYLQETYLAHLWSYIYAIIVINEEGIQKPMLTDDTWDGYIEYNTPLLQRAKRLFNWSYSLIDTYSSWDTTLPNPRIHACADEKFYAEKVNGLFQDAVVFLMFHEFAHLTKNHDLFFSKKKNYKYKEDEITTLIEIEKEADDFGINMLLHDDRSDIQKSTDILPVLLTIMSSFLIEPIEYKTFQKLHPSLDNRMLYLLQKIDLEDKKAHFYIYYLASFGVRFYLEKHKIIQREDDIGIFDTVKDLLDFYLSKLDDFRNKCT